MNALCGRREILRRHDSFNWWPSWRLKETGAVWPSPRQEATYLWPVAFLPHQSVKNHPLCLLKRGLCEIVTGTLGTSSNVLSIICWTTGYLTQAYCPLRSFPVLCDKCCTVGPSSWATFNPQDTQNRPVGSDFNSSFLLQWSPSYVTIPSARLQLSHKRGGLPSGGYSY